MNVTFYYREKEYPTFRLRTPLFDVELITKPLRKKKFDTMLKQKVCEAFHITQEEYNTCNIPYSITVKEGAVYCICHSSKYLESFTDSLICLLQSIPNQFQYVICRVNGDAEQCMLEKMQLELKDTHTILT